jgi:hypothetical protein
MPAGRPLANGLLGGVRYYGEKILPSPIRERHSSRDRSRATSHHWPMHVAEIGQVKALVPGVLKSGKL